MSFYWITRLDALNELFIAGIVTSVIVLGTAFMIFFFAEHFDCFFSSREDDKRVIRRYLKLIRTCVISILISTFGLVMTPTTKEMCAIIMVDYLKDNEKVQKMPEQIIDIASEYLEEQLKKGEEK